jgi:hypothetical protein
MNGLAFPLINAALAGFVQEPPGSEPSADGWRTDLGAARLEAAASKRPLLAVFR